MNLPCEFGFGVGLDFGFEVRLALRLHTYVLSVYIGIRFGDESRLGLGQES